jgi:hypothetical protein
MMLKELCWRLQINNDLPPTKSTTADFQNDHFNKYQNAEIRYQTAFYILDIRELDSQNLPFARMCWFDSSPGHYAESLIAQGFQQFLRNTVA